MIRIKVDYENNAEEWWGSGGRELWLQYDPTDSDEMVLTNKNGRRFLTKAAKIEGFDEGPEYAKYPFIYEEKYKND